VKKRFWSIFLTLMMAFVLIVPISVNADANFEVTNLSITPSQVKEGDSVFITADVVNTGDTAGTYTIELIINNTFIDSKDVTVEPGNSQAVSFAVTEDIFGDYSVEIDGLTGTFNVMPATLDLGSLRVDPAQVNEGESVFISAIATNTGNTTLDYPLKLMVDGITEATEDVSLPAGESTTVSFTVTRSEVGDYIIQVGSQTAVFKVKKSFWAMFPPYLWAVFGAIFGVLVMLIIVLVTTQPKKKMARADRRKEKAERMPKPTSPMTPGISPSVPPLTTVPPIPSGASPVVPSPTTGPPPMPRSPGIAPAALFSVTNLTITPNQVKENEPVTIGAVVTNNGTEAGNYSLVLRIGGVVDNINEMSLGPGTSQAATFTIVKDIAGEYYAEVDGLGCRFTVIPLVPATFTMSNLVISPDRVRQGESISISAVITNTGEVSGNYSVVLRIKGIAESIEEISLPPNRSQRVVFNITKDAPGFYQVALEGLTGRFVVEMEWNE